MMRLSPGDDLRKALRGGGEIVLAPGVHKGGHFIERDVVLRGEPGAVLDAGGRGAVLLVQDDGLTIEIEGLEITGGHAEVGGGLSVQGDVDLTVRRCVFRGNATLQLPAAGLGVELGRVSVERCVFDAHDDVYLTGGEVVLDECTVAGTVSALVGARLDVQGGSIGQLRLRGNPRRHPTVSISGAGIADVHNDAAFPGTLVSH